MIRWLACTIALITLLGCTPTRAAIPVYGYKVVHTYPHDTGAYTEGLFYKDGYLYESTGRNGLSSVRKVELKSGETLQRQTVPPEYFGEGIIDWKDHLIQLTWKGQTGFVYDLKTFKTLSRFAYPGEGWALTRDDKRIYMSDGTPTLRILDPDTLKQIGSINVTADGEPVANLNELEWVNGEIYANIWQTNRIVRIDPGNGHVVGWIDLTGLLDASLIRDPNDDVLNGIAWDAATKRLFVTGKHWPTLFEIKLVPEQH